MRFTSMLKVGVAGATLAAAVGVGIGDASAGTVVGCTFSRSGSTIRLQADCTTTVSIVIPAGKTLDGRGRTITASGGGFVDGVVVGYGPKASVKNLTLHAEGASSPSCEGDLFGGITLIDSGGSIENNKVYGPGCFFGAGILARSAPFDGSRPNTRKVDIERNVLDGFGDVGIYVSGDVRAETERNAVHVNTSEGMFPEFGVAYFQGARGEIKKNHVFGGQPGDLNIGVSAVIIASAESADVSENDLSGSLFAVGVASECRTGVTPKNVRVENNRLAAAAIGVYITAFVGGATICDPSVAGTTVRRNRIVGDPIGGFGVLIDVAPPDGGFTPSVTGTSIKNNQISGFDFCVEDFGGIDTQETNNTCELPVIAGAPGARLARPQLSSRLLQIGLSLKVDSGR